MKQSGLKIGEWDCGRLGVEWQTVLEEREREAAEWRTGRIGCSCNPLKPNN